jgi:serine/threonine protein kinase
MPISIGTQLGSHEITALLGKGGMGEVYRARDLKLKREVAIKILPEEFSSDADRVVRFQREAEVLASLNHPNIAGIYDLQEANGSRYLVLELVEGETLADRLARGPIPVEQALNIAIQICEALEAAHERGIIHRDLKPANVKLTPDGKVKVLDFGLAKAMEREPANSNFSNSPTLNVAATNAGVILGTAGYMSPEQAKGLAADVRSDIFAFGCVLYEMLSGKPAFEGETVSEILASVLMREPDLTKLPRNLNPGVYKLLQRCLNKDRKRRWHAAADLRIEMETVSSNLDIAPHIVKRGSRGRLWNAAFGLVTAIAVVFAILTFRPAAVPDELRLDITTPSTSDPISLAIAPDGKRVAFVVNQQGKSVLAVRSLDSTSIRSIPGTEGAAYPFWSPDGRTLGFFTDSKLKRVDLEGGAPQILAGAPTARGGSWSPNGTIIFAPVVGPLYRIPATGGDRIQLTQVEPPLSSHRFPRFLPDGRHFLFFGQGLPSASGVYLGSLDDSRITRLVSSDTTGLYDDHGALLFGRQKTLFAQIFDLSTKELHGAPVPIAEQIAGDPNVFSSALTAANGVIAFRSGAVGLRQLVWFDRSGKEIGELGSPDSGGLAVPELSPDEKRVAVYRSVDENTDIWTTDIGRGVPNRFTSDPSADIYPAWSPDGHWIAFGSTRRKGVYELYRKLSSNAGEEELLQESSQNQVPVDWSADGRFLLYRETDLKNGYDLWALPMSGDKKPIPIANTSFDEREGQFSPDVRWVAYTSNLSGSFEVYVQPFGRPGGRQAISTGGGIQPRWRHDGKELFYIAADNTLMSVPIKISPDGLSFEAGAAVPLYRSQLSRVAYLSSNNHQYAVSRDGQRFLMVTSPEDATPSPITVLLNWKPKF